MMMMTTTMIWHGLGQMVGSFSRIGLSLLTYFPPNRSGTFSDQAALARAVERPMNAFDAFQRAWEAGLIGIVGAAGGLVLDPLQVQSRFSLMFFRKG